MNKTSTPGPFWNDGKLYLGPFNSEADFNKSAAAPELLEALRNIIADLGYVQSDGWMSGEVYGKDYEKAKQVIAKAESNNS